MDLEYTFYLLKATRKNILSLTDKYSEEKLNKIPDGFRNNLIWNMGHVAVTQELLCYGLSGQNLHLSDDMVASFRKGTAPEKVVASAEIKRIRSILDTSIDQLEEDYQAGVFQKFNPYQTSYGADFDRIEQAIQFDLAHEAMHLGTILSILKFL
jgi:hypothetical protein